MKIPKRLKILGTTIEVVEDPALLYSHEWVGAADYTKCLIKMLPVNETWPATHEKRSQVFCHELVHHISYHAGAAINDELKKMLHQNEDFVDLFASILHQALSTMEYEDDK